MQKSFSAAKIGRFKREAKAIAKATGLNHSAALEQIARREGYEDWGLLTRNAKTQRIAGPALEAESTGVLTLGAFRAGLTQFIEALGAGGVRNLCGGGASLWVRFEEVAGGKLTSDHIEILGDASDLAYRQYARQHHLLLAVDYEGLSEGFVFDEDMDDDGEPARPDASSVKFTTTAGRKQLLDCLTFSGESDYEGLMDRYNLFLEES